MCIYGENVAEALNGTGLKGGAELQTALLARALAEDGIPVTLVDPSALCDQKPFENLAVRAVPRYNDGIRGLRYLTHRLPNLIRCLTAGDVSAYYVRGYTYHHLAPLAVAKKRGALFVWAVASDTDLLRFRDRYRKSYKGVASFWSWISTVLPNELAHRFLLSGADFIFAQHPEQVLLAKKRSQKVVQFNNIVDPAVRKISPSEPRGNVLIVGTLSLAKGLQVLLPIVREFHGITFEFVGEVTDQEGALVKKGLTQCPNAVLRGPLDRRSTLERIAAAKVLVNTSPKEGFPNTFLEAWALGTPVVSLFVDPGGVLKTHNLGYACDGDMGMFKELLQRDTYDLDPAVMKQYVEEHHSMQHALHVFTDLLELRPSGQRV